MLEIVFGTHNQLPVDDFMVVAIIRQRRQVGLGPDLPWNTNRDTHGVTLSVRRVSVEVCGSGDRADRGFGSNELSKAAAK
jgi:hypothetical protein